MTLTASLAHWRRNAQAGSPEAATTAPDDDPLCQQFLHEHACEGCPVYAKTGLYGCRGTPYPAAYDALRAWEEGTGDGEQFRAAARANARFLEALLHPQQPA